MRFASSALRLLDEKRALSITEVDCKEERSAGHATAPILNDLEIFSRNTLRSFRATFALATGWRLFMAAPNDR